MSQVVPPEVFTPDELAQAAGVAPGVVSALLVTGELKPVPGTRFIAAADAVRAGRRLRTEAALLPVAAPSGILATAGRASTGERRIGLPAFATSFAHAALFLVLLWLTTLPADTAASDQAVDEPARLVFIVSPGPGGGGAVAGCATHFRPARSNAAASSVPGYRCRP